MPTPFSYRWPSQLLLLVACWAGAARLAQAQTDHPAASIRVSGTVSDAGSKRELAGASVLVQRTRRGVATDAQGDFALTAFSTDTLLFRALGYKPYRLALQGTALSQLVVQVRLQRDSVRLGEVRVTADRADRASINRALRNMRRPAPPVAKAPVQVKPKPLFPVDSTPPPPPPPGGTPIGWAYEKFSRAGKERRKMKQIKVEEVRQQANRRRLEYNKAFKDNRGYE